MSSETEEQPTEEYEKGNSDPDKLVQCPFDKNHKIRVCRFPYHLMKCRKNHPKLASELKTCPFNARHLVHKHELAHHTQTCEDRISVDAEDAERKNGHCNWHVPVSTWVNSSATEDWDKEADEFPTPFVWGVNTVVTQTTVVRPTNSLGLNSRPPTTFPWPGYEA
ncbi:gametocyte-specific factor 1 [Cololabis saira]|uniref:gametocyte-specific factor 1 n=1 Tax=Cololabis saira TaxID=129043 RepID=UPI002AD3D256|nr:gametocyte-specific factor 1 [Cololabis saira]